MTVTINHIRIFAVAKFVKILTVNPAGHAYVAGLTTKSIRGVMGGDGQMMFDVD